MPIYSPYATKADLAEYLYVDELDLPENAERLLMRASEFIQQVTIGNIDNSNLKHLEALKLATCAQVEYWNTIGETVAAGINSFSLGDLSMDVSKSGLASPSASLSSRSRGYLNEQGLMYRGIKGVETI